MIAQLAPLTEALERADAQLVQLVFKGDSTWAGQVRDADAPNYSPVTRIRQRLAAAGLHDGGHGVMNGSLDTASVSGEPADAYAIDPAYEINNGQNLVANYTGSTNTVGATYRAGVYGTRVVVRWALYDSPSVYDITVDGVTTRITTATKTNTSGSTDGNWQAGGHRLFSGLTYGLHTVTVTLVSGRMSVLVEGTRNTGFVLHNFSARGGRAVDVPWHQVQSWTGRTPTANSPVVPAPADTTQGALTAVAGLTGDGTNDQQGNGSVDTSDAYGAKVYDFARSFTNIGKAAVICSPWWEAAGHPEFAASFRAVSQEAAQQAGALWLDLGPGGALAGHTNEDLGGTNANPHLTALAYRYQGDYIADALLADVATLPGVPGQVGGRPIVGYRLGGRSRSVIDLRRPA